MLLLLLKMSCLSHPLIFVSCIAKFFFQAGPRLDGTVSGTRPGNVSAAGEEKSEVVEL